MNPSAIGLASVTGWDRTAPRAYRLTGEAGANPTPRRLQHHRRAHAAGDGAPLAEALVADALAVRAEADLRWLDLYESRILRTTHDGGAA